MKAKDFMTFKKWAVVGDVTNDSKYAYKILNRLKAAGYMVEGVNPKGVQGAFNSLKEVPYTIEVLDLCINPVRGLEILKESKELNIQHVLIQPGAESDEIHDYCRENNIKAVNGCALVELSNL